MMRTVGIALLVILSPLILVWWLVAAIGCGFYLLGAMVATMMIDAYEAYEGRERR